MAKSTSARPPLKPGSGPGPRTVYRATPRRRTRRTSSRTRLVVVLGVAAIAAIVLVRAISMQGAVASGVSVQGVDIGGLSAEDARLKLKAELVPRLHRDVSVTLDAQTAPMNPAELDAHIDLRRTVDIAMQTGRLASLLLPFVYSADVAPTIATPLRPRIPANIRMIAEPARNASVRIANGRVAISPARDGHSISPRQILHSAAVAALDGRTRVVLRSKVTKPAISTADARAAATQALKIAGAPVAVNVDGSRVGALPTSALQNAVAVRIDDDKAVIAFSPKALAPALRSVLGSHIRDPVNAMWDTNGTRAWVVPARDGIGFDPKQAAEAVRAAAIGGGVRQADIALEKIAPARSTDEAGKLGITTRIAGAQTELGDSSENRIHNVGLMAGILDNRLVMPGQEFSFNDAVGPRTPERGFLEGQAIVDGLLIPSIGGGVCQVATTLFDAVFAAGLQVDERHNHDLYISHYGLGMDATVSWGDLDFRFTNDTDHPILIRATADSSSMIVNLYSAPADERTVESTTSNRYAVQKPEKRYILDPYAPPKRIEKYVDGQDGFAVDVQRIVKKNGKVLSNDTFVSTYITQPDTYIVGPGAELPGNATYDDPPEGWISPYAPGGN